MNFEKIYSYEIDQREELILQTREVSWSFLDFIFRTIESSSMTEREIIDFIYGCSASHGIDKHWHPPKVKIHKTLISIDIGPVISHIEGDVGETRYFGIYNEEFETIIKLGVKYFRQFQTLINFKYTFKDAANIVCQSFSEEEKSDYQMILNLHLLGKAFHKQLVPEKINLIEFDYIPKKSTWILEVLINDEQNNRSSFFEDLILIKSS
jgi:hypothetical protein